MASSLEAVLHRARTVGFLGPGPVRAHIEHAGRYLEAIPADTRTMIDLGSGGGVPGLVILEARPMLHAVLLDAAAKRGAFLHWATLELGIADRTTVAVGRAEDLAWQETYRSRFDVTVARGFGPPASTLENARGYVVDGGLVIISEPPQGRYWPDEALDRLALERLAGPDGVVVFQSLGEVPNGIPRRHKDQQRAPLF